MARWRVTWFLNTEVYGWSYSLHHTSPQLASVQQATSGMTPTFASLLGKDGAVDYVRISDDEVFRDQNGQQTGLPASGPQNVNVCAPPFIAAYLRLHGINFNNQPPGQINSGLYLAGFPTDYLVGNVIVPSPAWNANAQVLKSRLVTDGWGIQTLFNFQNQPQQAISCDFLAPASTLFTVTMAAARPPTWVVGQKLKVSGMPRGATVKKPVQIVGLPSDPTHVTISGWTAGPWVLPFTLTSRLYAIAPIGGVDVEFVRKRNRGRFFELPRGRSRAA